MRRWRTTEHEKSRDPKPFIFVKRNTSPTAESREKQPDVSLVTGLIGFGWNQSPEPRGHTRSVPVLARFDNPAAVRSREDKIVGFLVVATSTQNLENFELFVWWLYALYVFSNPDPPVPAVTISYNPDHRSGGID